MIPLLPEKHVRLGESFLGLGALVLNQLQEPKTIDDIWEILRDLRIRKKLLPEHINFEDLILTIDILYGLKAVKINEKGEITLCV